jgi:hypothetical protein
MSLLFAFRWNLLKLATQKSQQLLLRAVWLARIKVELDVSFPTPPARADREGYLPTGGLYPPFFRNALLSMALAG